MDLAKRVKQSRKLKHTGSIILAATILLAIPEAAIALDASAATSSIEVSAISAAVKADEDYSSVTTAVIEKTAIQYTGAVAFIEAEKAAAELKAKTEADAKAKKAAEKKAAEKAAALKAEKAAKAEKAKKAQAAAKSSAATAAKTETAASETANPAGIPSEYTVKKSFSVKAYAYTGGGTTASGKKAGVGLIAVDPKVIPLGTVLYVEGYGVCVAADTGGNIKGRTVDLYMDSEKACRNWGKRSVTCYILTK